jgi:phosphopantetheinyl transferase
MPRQFGRLPGWEEAGIIRRPWRRPAQTVGRMQGWCCQCIEQNTPGAWDQAAAPYVLHEPEWMVWRRLPRAAARRQWLRGRVAAKDAVRWLLFERYRLVAPLEAICVLPDERGRPCVSCAAPADVRAEIFVSISHCGNTSVALAAERSGSCRGVGIDVASEADPHEGLAEGAFAAFETALLKSRAAPDRAHWLLRLWCAKEAVGKALGLGLMGNPLNYVVRGLNLAQRMARVEIAFDSTAVSGMPARMTARMGSGRGMAFAVARLE